MANALRLDKLDAYNKVMHESLRNSHLDSLRLNFIKLHASTVRNFRTEMLLCSITYRKKLRIFSTLKLRNFNSSDISLYFLLLFIPT